MPILAVDLDRLEACQNPRAHSLGLLGHTCKPTPWRGIKTEVRDQLVVAAPLAMPLLGVTTAGGLVNLPRLATLHPNVLTGIGGLTASLLDPNPNADYPGNLDNLLRGGKLLLGKSQVMKAYADKIPDAFHMFKPGFGLGVPSILKPSSQIMNAIYTNC